MKKTNNVIIFILIPLVVLVIANILFYKESNSSPAVWDAEDLTNIWTINEDYEKLIYKHELADGDGVVCFATIADDDDSLAMIYLEKNRDGYSNKSSYTFNLHELTEDCETYDEMPAVNSIFKDQKIYYWVFKNPQIESVIIGDEEIPVQKIVFDLGGETHTLGFWCALVPKDAENIFS